MTNTLGVYVHIPFCTQKCGYCDFYSVTAQKERMDLYGKALRAHIRESAQFTTGYGVDTIYFGGGTPTVAGEKQLGAVLSELKKRFRVSPNAEITVEANPESVTPKLLKKLRKTGFNRLSLGIQSLDDKQLQALGRPHTAAQAKEAFDLGRKAGFDNISVDILYGLPGQTTESFEDTLGELLDWQPEHISAYGLTLSEDVPLYGVEQPNDDEQSAQYLLCAQTLKTAGYRHYEISNFAKPSRESRHNWKYWTLQEYIGFGPSAHSDFSGRRYAFVKNLQEYCDNVLSGGEIISEMEKISPEERAGEYLMLGLRTNRGVGSNEYTRMFRVSFDAVEKNMEILQKAGYAAQEGDRWHLTEQGFLLSNQIIGRLLDVSPAETGILFS